MTGSARETTSPLPSIHSSVKSIDAGTLELGVKSAWTCDKTFVTGVEGTESLRAEPPTSGHGDLSSTEVNSSKPRTRALDAPIETSTPFLNDEINEIEILPVTPDYEDSKSWILSPILGSIDEHSRSRIRYGHPMDEPINSPRINPLRASITLDQGCTPCLSEILSWADSTENDGLGEILDFPVLSPVSHPTSLTTDQHILSDDKGKKVNRSEKQEPETQEEFKGQADLIDELNERVRELEKLVIQSQTREEEARKQVTKARRAPTVSKQALCTRNDEDTPPKVQTREAPTEKYDVENTRFQRALSILPPTSSVKKAMLGSQREPPDPGSPDDSPDDDEHSSTESSSDEDAIPVKLRRPQMTHPGNLADTASDVDEREMVRQFWMNCKPYIKASLVDKGYEPNTISMDVIEKKALRTERVFLENTKDPNILLALNPTLAAGTNIRSAALEEGLVHGLYGMAIKPFSDSEPSTMTHLEAVNRTLLALYNAVPLATDEVHDPLYDPFSKDQSTLLNWGGPDTYLLKDKHNDDLYIIYYGQMCDPEFNPAAWLLDLKLRYYSDLILSTKDVRTPSWSITREEYLRLLPRLSISLSDDECESVWDDPSTPCEDDISLMGLEAHLSAQDDADNLYCGVSSSLLPDVRSIQHNAARPKTSTRLLPRSLVVVILQWLKKVSQCLRIFK
ncbi:hypothetical protein DFH29DRAFT_997045 [Suillus ampliporus]|nr:hypothetical protein DFH29DRAFT_997045 [Suillus ampliporus]